MDQLKELFESIESEILTDEVKLQMSTLFESALNEAIEAKEQELEESNREEIQTFKEDLVEQIDSYLDYFTKEYIKENEQVVEDFSKVKLAEKVLRNFQQMVEAFNISLSDESIDSEEEVEELKAENTTLVNKLIESRKENKKVKMAIMISEASQSLETDIQREKLVSLASKLEFDEDIFESKLEVLVDKILAEKEEVKEDKLEEKEEEQIIESKTTDSMKKYLQFI